MLQEQSWDQAVNRGWMVIERKLRVRRWTRRAAAGGAALSLIASGVSVFLNWPAPESDPEPTLALLAPPPKLDNLVVDLPKVTQKARTPAMRRAPAVVVAPAENPDIDQVGQLLLSVQDAWKANNVQRVAALLAEVAEHHPRDPRAAQSLYLLGRIQLERFKDRKAAAISLHHALELNPSEDLVPAIWAAYQRAGGPPPAPAGPSPYESTEEPEE
jgi:tRNA nucleotidyltransferase/poly(A) polymerase